MAKWATLTRGKRARKKDVSFTSLESDEPVLLDLKVLDGADDAAVLEYATMFAKSKGGDAKDGDELFEYGKARKTVELACIDKDSTDDKPEPFFASMDEVDAALDRDRILSLAYQQKLFQAIASPFKYAMTDDEFADAIVDIAFREEGDPGPFASWPPQLQWSFTRILAFRFVRSQTHNSSTSSSVDDKATS